MWSLGRIEDCGGAHCLNASQLTGSENRLRVAAERRGILARGFTHVIGFDDAPFREAIGAMCWS